MSHPPLWVMLDIIGILLFYNVSLMWFEYRIRELEKKLKALEQLTPPGAGT